MPRTYSLPDFNVETFVWFDHFSSDFSTWNDDPPDIADAVTITAQLYTDAHDQVAFGHWTTSQFGTATVLHGGIELRVPKETQAGMLTPHVVADRRHAVFYCGPDADGKFRFYVVQGELVRHKGFPNEHKAWICNQWITLDDDPYP